MWSDELPEILHPSSVLLETSPLCSRWESLEGLSNRMIKGPREKRYFVEALTLYPPSFQISLGRDSSNRSKEYSSTHNVSNTGSSKLLQQHARLTADPFPLDATSSWAISLTISSMLRQVCIGSIRRVQSCIESSTVHGLDGDSHSMPMFPWR